MLHRCLVVIINCNKFCNDELRTCCVYKYIRKCTAFLLAYLKVWLCSSSILSPNHNTSGMQCRHSLVNWILVHSFFWFLKVVVLYSSTGDFAHFASCVFLKITQPPNIFVVAHPITQMKPLYRSTVPSYKHRMEY